MSTAGEQGLGTRRSRGSPGIPAPPVPRTCRGEQGLDGEHEAGGRHSTPKPKGHKTTAAREATFLGEQAESEHLSSIKGCRGGSGR